MEYKYICLACKGTGKRGRYEGYIFTCPYCLGKKGFTTRREQRDKGLCSGDIDRASVQTELELI